MRMMLKDTPNKTRHETEDNKQETTWYALGMWNKDSNCSTDYW